MTSSTGEGITVRVLLWGTPGLRDRLLSTADGGAVLLRALTELVTELHGGSVRIETRFEERGAARALLEEVAAASETPVSLSTDPTWTRPDLIVMSLDADLAAADGSWGSDTAERFEADMLRIIRSIKQIGSHLIMLNASTVDPDEQVSSFRGVDREPRFLTAHRLNLATMHLSSEEAISIVDVDRVVAEIGASRCVPRFQEFSSDACDAIIRELIRIMAEYGFFDERPLVPQVGQRVVVDVERGVMTARSGGKDVLRVFLKGNRDLTDVLLSQSDGGGKMVEGLKELVAQRSTGAVRVDIQHEPRSGHRRFAEEIAAGESALTSSGPDLAILSLGPDLLDEPAADSAAFVADFTSVIVALKNQGTHVLILNASTVDPSLSVSNYSGIDEPFTRRAQRLDLELLKLSMNEGISVIDADQLLAELGAGDHVLAPLDYSSDACSALCAETFRIIEDYGFFEARPLLAQIGRREA